MNAHEWGLLAATLVPLLVAILARWSWSSTAKFALASGISLALGVGTAYFAGSLSAEKLVTSVLAVIGAAQAAHYLVFKPLGWTDWILSEIGNVEPISEGTLKRRKR